MTPVFILSAIAVLGIEVGWEPLAEGGHEYTIQIEPQLLDLLHQGREIISEVPPQIHVRRYRVTVGTQKLAQVDGEPQGALPPSHDRPTPAENPFTHAPPEPTPAEQAQTPSEQDPLTFSNPEPAAEVPPADHARSKHRASSPGMLPVISSDSKPIETRPAAHHEPANVDTNKPTLPASAEPTHAWLPLSMAIMLLCCSMGANIYLGWIARDARRGHREALSRIRPAGAA